MSQTDDRWASSPLCFISILTILEIYSFLIWLVEFCSLSPVLLAYFCSGLPFLKLSVHLLKLFLKCLLQNATLKVDGFKLRNSCLKKKTMKSNWWGDRPTGNCGLPEPALTFESLKQRNSLNRVAISKPQCNFIPNWREGEEVAVLWACHLPFVLTLILILATWKVQSVKPGGCLWFSLCSMATRDCLYQVSYSVAMGKCLNGEKTWSKWMPVCWRYPMKNSPVTLWTSWTGSEWRSLLDSSWQEFVVAMSGPCLELLWNSEGKDPRALCLYPGSTTDAMLFRFRIKHANNTSLFDVCSEWNLLSLAWKICFHVLIAFYYPHQQLLISNKSLVPMAPEYLWCRVNEGQGAWL